MKTGGRRGRDKNKLNRDVLTDLIFVQRGECLLQCSVGYTYHCYHFASCWKEWLMSWSSARSEMEAGKGEEVQSEDVLTPL